MVEWGLCHVVKCSVVQNSKLDMIHCVKSQGRFLASDFPKMHRCNHQAEVGSNMDIFFFLFFFLINAPRYNAPVFWFEYNLEPTS